MSNKFHFTGLILTHIRNAVKAANAQADSAKSDIVMIDNVQENGVWGVHQARVMLDNDETVYRLILAPADAPIKIGTMDADDHFRTRIRG